MKKYTNWENVNIRRNCNGHYYLLQMRIRSDGKIQFVNRNIDKLPKFTSVLGMELFQNEQESPNNFLKKLF